MVTIEEIERDAIHALAKDERRDTRAQAALLIREALERRGLIETRATKRNAATGKVTNANAA